MVFHRKSKQEITEYLLTLNLIGSDQVREIVNRMELYMREYTKNPVAKFEDYSFELVLDETKNGFQVGELQLLP